MISQAVHTNINTTGPYGKQAPAEKRSVADILVAIPGSVRIAIIAYFIIYQLFIPLKTVISHNSDLEAYAFTFLNIFYSFLILLPVLNGWKSVGLLHPLVWPTLFSIAKTFKDPLSFVAPFYEDASLYEVSSRITGLDKGQLIASNFQLIFLQIGAIVLTYAGYFFTKSNHYIKLKAKLPTASSQRRLIVWAFFCLVIAYGFFLSQGGVKAWINNWGLSGGRHEATEGFGPILSFIGSLYYIPALWILFRNQKAFKDILFWVFIVSFTLSCFVVTGSRYAVLQALTTYLMAWVLLNKNFPIGKVFLGGCGFIILFGMLGMLRTSGSFKGQAADWSVLNGDISSYLDYALEDAANRVDSRTDLSIIQKVPDKVDYLYGQSYLSIFAAYIPRAIWPDKPHTGAYYTGYLIFNVPWGVPPSEVGEAFWNFGLIGFFAFFFFKGMIYKYIVNTFVKYYAYPAVAVVYFMLLFNGGSFVSLALTDLLREMIFMLVGLKILKLI